MPATIRDVLRTLTADPGRPRLTWYGDGGERIELSGAVLANWVSKTTNLLVEEFDAEPGTVVATDLPPHWRTLVWALATWQSGAEVRIVDGPVLTSASAADVVVTATPERWLGPDGRRPAHGELVAVSLPALARRYDGELPAGAVDAASAVMTYGDVVGYVPPTDPRATALVGAGVARAVEHSALLDWAREHGGAGEHGGRVLVQISDAPGAVALLLARALAVWAHDGSVVMLGPETTAALAADPSRLARLVETERVSAG